MTRARGQFEWVSKKDQYTPRLQVSEELRRRSTEQTASRTISETLGVLHTGEIASSSERDAEFLEHLDCGFALEVALSLQTCRKCSGVKITRLETSLG